MTKSYIRRGIALEQTVTGAEDTSGIIYIQVIATTSVPTAGTDPFMFLHQVKRAGVEIPGFKSAYTTTTGAVKLENAGSADLTSGDIVTIMGNFYQV